MRPRHTRRKVDRADLDGDSVGIRAGPVAVAIVGRLELRRRRVVAGSAGAAVGVPIDLGSGSSLDLQPAGPRPPPTSSVLARPMVVSASALTWESRCEPNEGRASNPSRRSVSRTEVSWLPRSEWCTSSPRRSSQRKTAMASAARGSSVCRWRHPPRSSTPPARTPKGRSASIDNAACSPTGTSRLCPLRRQWACDEERRRILNRLTAAKALSCRWDDRIAGSVRRGRRRDRGCAPCRRRRTASRR